MDAMAAAPPSAGVPEGWQVESTPRTAPPVKTGIPEGWEPETTTTVDHAVEPERKRPPNPNAEPSDEQIPGFFQTFGSAVGRKAAEAAANLAAGTQILLPKGVGGKTLQESIQDGDVHPQTQDYIDKLLGEDLTQGWYKPKWWIAQLGANVGGVAPGLGTAIGATAVGGPLAGIAAFGGEAAIERLVPAYKAAVAAGLPPDQATTRALVDSGIAATFATAMGLAGKVGVTKPLAEYVGRVLSPTALEALAQLGIVQPGLMAGQDVATSLAHGETPEAHQIMTDMVVGGLGGLAIHGTFRGLDRVQELRKGGGEEARPPTAEEIAAAAEAQRPEPGFARGVLRRAGQVPEPPGITGVQQQEEEPGFENLGGYHERDVTPAWVSERPSYWYSQISRAVDEMPEKFQGKDLINFLKKRGAKDDEINDLDLRGFLKDSDGQIRKTDLQAWIEANQVQVWEKIYRDMPKDYNPMTEANELYDHYTRMYGTGNQDQWAPRVQRHFNQVYEAAQREAVDMIARGPQYRSQLLPGLNHNPEEITFRTPPPTFTPEQVIDKAVAMRANEMAAIEADYPGRKVLPYNQLSEKIKAGYRDRALEALQGESSFTGSHWSDPNVFAHARITYEVDRDGHNSAVIHELQSDAHQLGAKIGYAAAGEAKLRDPDAIRADLRPLDAEIAIMMRDNHVLWPEDLLARKLTPEEEATYHRWDELRKELAEATSPSRKKPPAALPFKTNWQELAIKRLLQMFADKGVDRIYMMNGDQVGMRLGVHDENGNLDVKASKAQVDAARMSYDKKNWSLLEKWAKKSGAETGIGRFELPEDLYSNLPQFMQETQKLEHKQMGVDPERVRGNMRFVTMNPSIATHIREYGMPLHEGDVGPPKRLHTLSEQLRVNGAPEHLLRPAQKLDSVMQKIVSELGMSRGIQFRVFTDPQGTYRGRMLPHVDPLTGNWQLETNLSLIHTEADLYAAMSHELGHAIKKDMFETASAAEQASILKVFRDFRARLNKDDLTVGDVRRARDNAISEITGARSADKGWRLDELEPRSRAYLLHFDEWFSEQVAKWMQTDARPMGVVEKFFKRLANKIVKMISTFRKTSGRGPIAPAQAVAEFLNRRWDKAPDPWVGPHIEQFERDSTAANRAAMDKEGAPDTTAVPQQASTASGREIIKSLPPSVAGNGEAMAAHADRMNAFYDLTLSLPQVQQLNRHIPQLARYTDMHRLAYREIQDIASAAQDRALQWGRIRDPAQLKGLTNAIHDYARGLFKLPHTEDGIDRRPNNEEWAALIKKHGLNKQALDVFTGVIQDFDAALEKYRTLLINDAKASIKDPAQLARNLQNINATIDKQLRRPFIPLTRFGKYLVTVYDANKKIRESHQVGSLREQGRLVEALKASTDRLPGDSVLPGLVPKDAMPFLGMPPGLLDLMDKKLGLSPSQRSVLDQLRFDYAPGHSFKHQFRETDLTPGYSTNFLRNYANFFHHFSRHVTRLKWVDAMRDQIRGLGDDEVRLSRLGNRGGAVKLDRIVKFMQKHFDAWVDPKNDWAGLRGLMFHWYLGFNPASAAVNLTQTPLMTYPYLASLYGDLRATGALLKASTRFANYFRKPKLMAASKDMQATALDKALAEGIRQGTISETQSHQLAAISEDRNLLRMFGSKAERGWLKFAEMSSWMFEMTEQANRRLAFAAAHELAYNHPDHKAVREAIEDSPLSYQKMLSGDNSEKRRWTPQEAGAFLAAQKAVNATQFEYAQYARPRLMRGPIGSTALVFKLFTQNTVFNLMSHPGMLARWALIMAALGGMQGLLGAENVNGIVKALGWQLFGKDWDLFDEIRHFSHDVLNDAIGPDLLLHGASVRGFGLPAVMHSMGFHAFPTVDMSRSIGVGDVLGFDPTKPLQPTKAPREEEFRQMERAAGAAFGLPMSLYDFAASSQDVSKLKSYEALIPRFLGNLSKAYRYGTEGMETNRAGNAVVKFDPYDSENMMEILAQGLGFQPRRKTEAWEKVAGVAEAITYWDLRRSGLMRQFADAVKKGDAEGKERTIEAIRNYNTKLPPEARSKSITAKELRSSVQQRMQVKARQEAGLPAVKANIPIAKGLEPYYPSGWDKDQVGAQGVK
jgi:hypothetical protein